MQGKEILIVEDDAALQEALVDTLQLAGFQTQVANHGEEAVQHLERECPDLILTDMQMDVLNGLELLKQVKRRWPGIPVLLMTAYGTVDTAIEAIRYGAVDYLLKPFEPDVLLSKIKRYLPEKKLDSEEPVCQDVKSKAMFALARQVAKSNASVLISGASGTGKEVIARYIHTHSTRSKRPFVAINCAAIPENMLEATLFGYEKGAYTGAHKSNPGKFEQAQYGTLLLDEISEMDLGLQAKLLRVLQEKELERLGGQKTIPLDVRVIATTNRYLKDEVKKGRFREDLYYRLNVFPLHWMPLSERKEDILPLSEHFLKKYHPAASGGPLHFDETAQAKLTQYNWAGNVRELENVVQRALILKQGPTITAEDIQFDPSEMVAEIDHALSQDVQDHEHEIILKALIEMNGSRKKVAEKLSISPRTLRYKLAKMREAGIDVPVAVYAES